MIDADGNGNKEHKDKEEKRGRPRGNKKSTENTYLGFGTSRYRQASHHVPNS